MGNLLDSHAQQHLWDYDEQCLHYNLVADAVYSERRKTHDPQLPEFERYIIAGLICFDMGRMMGSRETMYSETGGFRAMLRKCLKEIEPQLLRLSKAGDLLTADFKMHSDDIEKVYSGFAEKRKLHPTKRFDVGATKILHWLFPNLFLMVDRNAARAFNKCGDVKFKTGTQPGYTTKKYVDRLSAAQQEIRRYEEIEKSKFRALAPNTPIARVFDKIAFMVGGGRVEIDTEV